MIKYRNEKGEAMIERQRDRGHEVRGRDRVHVARERVARERA